MPGPHNEQVLDLLFVYATWHAYAKLRIQSESTMSSFDTITKDLGVQQRRFVSTTCSAYDTKELPHEEAARGRRKAAMLQNAGGNTSTRRAPASNRGNTSGQQSSGAARRKTFSLKTPKQHSLSHYPNAIRKHGTCDSYNTQIVSNQLNILEVACTNISSC